MSRFHALLLAHIDPATGESALDARFFSSVSAANAARAAEVSSITAIQALARQFCATRRYRHAMNAIVMIQKLVRGYLGRRRMRRHRVETAWARFHGRIHFAATVIQSAWRGYRERMLRGNDMRRRREYVVRVCEAAEAVRREAAEHEWKTRESSEAETAAKRDVEFRLVAGNLHHLLGTKRIPGIYRPPHLQAMNSGGYAVNGGEDVENSIRRVVAEDLRASRMQSMAISPASTTAADSSLGLRPHGGMRKPVTGSSLHASRSRSTLGQTGQRTGEFAEKFINHPHLSVRAAAPYDAVRETARMERLVSEKMRLSGHFKVPKAKTHLPPMESVHVGIPYNNVAVVLREEDKTKRIAADSDFISSTRAAKVSFDGAPIMDSRASLVRNKERHAQSLAAGSP